MLCPKCKGKLVLEDKVLFCEDCLHVVDRNFTRSYDTTRLASHEKRGKCRTTFYGKREKEILSMLKRWCPGKTVSCKPGGIKGRICINKRGNIYYGYMRHKVLKLSCKVDFGG